MKAAQLISPVLLSLLLLGCGRDNSPSTPPPPATLTSEAIGHYCGMNLYEHTGPKGQILLRDHPDPVWFSTIREVFAYTLLPEEPKAILAIYVQDMGQAGPDGSPPDNGAWIDARQAHYLITNETPGALFAPDLLPFSKLEDAQAYAKRYGGQIVGFEDMPEDDILRAPAPNPPADNTSVGAFS